MNEPKLPLLLIVEDNEDHIELLRDRFRKAHLMNPVHVARDGVEAVSYLAGEGTYQDRDAYPLPGIAILDLMLPRMDGFELLLWIRARPEFNKMPAIVLTSHGDDPMVERARQCGADGFLVKGVDTDGLIELLKNAFLGWALVPIGSPGDSLTMV
jgi:CheY-like chemotaxis protein